jgi:hypothetical protein
MASADFEFMTLRNLTAYQPDGTRVLPNYMMITSTNGGVLFTDNITISSVNTSSITTNSILTSSISTNSLFTSTISANIVTASSILANFLNASIELASTIIVSSIFPDTIYDNTNSGGNLGQILTAGSGGELYWADPSGIADVEYVSSGRNITVDNTDYQKPIINLNNSINLSTITVSTISSLSIIDSSGLSGINRQALTIGPSNNLVWSTILPLGTNYSDYLFWSTGTNSWTVDSTRVHIGADAGLDNQGDGSVAIGSEAGSNNQGNDCIAIGNTAGSQNQSNTSIAIGYFAGMNSQAIHSIAIGASAGNLYQSTTALAIGDGAGYSSQGINTVAIGSLSGSMSQQNAAIAIGRISGTNNQSTSAIAIGQGSGYNNQGQFAIAIGEGAGASNQGQYSIAIGAGAGNQIQSTNTIVINAAGGILNTSGSSNSLFIKPIRSEGTNTGNILQYDIVTSEITYTSVAANGVWAADNNNIYNTNTGNVLISTPQLIVSTVTITQTPNDIITTLNYMNAANNTINIGTVYTSDDLGELAYTHVNQNCDPANSFIDIYAQGETRATIKLHARALAPNNEIIEHTLDAENLLHTLTGNVSVTGELCASTLCTSTLSMTSGQITGLTSINGSPYPPVLMAPAVLNTDLYRNTFGPTGPTSYTISALLSGLSISGIVAVRITAQGGGGGGAAGTSGGGGGGGAGASISQFVYLNTTDSLTLVVGSGGGGGIMGVGAPNGSDGGNTHITFSNNFYNIFCYGGQGGRGGGSTNNNGGVGGAGQFGGGGGAGRSDNGIIGTGGTQGMSHGWPHLSITSAGLTNGANGVGSGPYSGGIGGQGEVTMAQPSVNVGGGGGGGGASLFANGGGGGSVGYAGVPGQLGSGGGGGGTANWTLDSSAKNGGKGGDGFVRIEIFKY